MHVVIRVYTRCQRRLRGLKTTSAVLWHTWMVRHKHFPNLENYQEKSDPKKKLERKIPPKKKQRKQKTVKTSLKHENTLINMRNTQTNSENTFQIIEKTTTEKNLENQNKLFSTNNSIRNKTENNYRNQQ